MTAPVSRPYALYDVFTATPFCGNPLAVVFAADGLSDERMQTIAAEFNLSETVFINKPVNPAHTAALRIFTAVQELPFAGHPTVGAAIAIVEARRIAAGDALSGVNTSVEMLEEKIGLVRAAVRIAPDRPGFCEFDLPKRSAHVEVDFDEAMIAAALGLGLHEIGFENHRMGVWSAGVPILLVPVGDVETVSRAVCNATLWQETAPVVAGKEGPAFAYVYSRGGVSHDADFHARMFAPGEGFVEDPATGAAVAALSGAIALFDGLNDGHHNYRIEQGVEMGRPSSIGLHLDVAGGQVAQARIGGEAVMIASGHLLV